MIDTTERLKIGDVTVRARRRGAPANMSGTTWWDISAASAKKIMVATFPGKRVPRPGYEVLMPESNLGGHRGQWTLVNRAGRFELMFYYKA